MVPRPALVLVLSCGASLVPACRCTSSSEPSTAGAGGEPGARPTHPAGSASIDTAALRRVNLRPNLRPLLLNPSAVRPPPAAPTASH